MSYVEKKILIKKKGKIYLDNLKSWLSLFLANKDLNVTHLFQCNTELLSLKQWGYSQFTPV